MEYNTEKNYRQNTKTSTYNTNGRPEINRKLHNLRTQMGNEKRKINKRTSGEGTDDVVFSPD